MSLRNQDRLRGSGIFTFPFDVRETDYSCSHLIGWSVQFFTRPNTNGPVFYPTKGRLGPKKSKMAAVFVQERNAASILVMSVSSWCEGHRSRQELNEISFCEFKCKKFRKFSRKSLLSSRSTGVYSHQPDQELRNLCSPEERKLKSDATGKGLNTKR